MLEVVTLFLNQDTFYTVLKVLRLFLRESLGCISDKVVLFFEEAWRLLLDPILLSFPILRNCVSHSGSYKPEFYALKPSV